MNEYICYLVTLVYDDRLIRCALKLRKDLLFGDCVEYPMEHENRKQIWNLLPTHVKSCGKIVDVEKIFEIHEQKETK